MRRILRATKGGPKFPQRNVCGGPKTILEALQVEVNANDAWYGMNL